MKQERPKTRRCPVCRGKIRIGPLGRVPIYCGRTCQQRAYERRKWQRPSPVEALARDIATARGRAEVRKIVWELLIEIGLVEGPAPPSLQNRPRTTLRLVKKRDED